MFLPPELVEADLKVIRGIIRQNPLGVITTAIPSDTHPLIQASHIPFILDIEDESSDTELGRLRAHLARQNPQSQAIVQSLKHKPKHKQKPNDTDLLAPPTATTASVLEAEVLVQFTAAAHHYVTPKFYTETKPATGKVVPTWDYATVQAYGTATIYHDHTDPSTDHWLTKQLTDLSRFAEKTISQHTGPADGRPEPWEVSDAPERFIELLKKNLIGVEIVIHRLHGKVKMSQDKRLGDRRGVIEGFEALGTDIGKDMAAFVREYSDKREAGKQQQ